CELRLAIRVPSGISRPIDSMRPSLPRARTAAQDAASSAVAGAPPGVDVETEHALRLAIQSCRAVSHGRSIRYRRRCIAWVAAQGAVSNAAAGPGAERRRRDRA